MEGMKITSDNDKIIIEISKNYITSEFTSENWSASHSIANISNENAAIEYITNALKEPSQDVGDGYVTPVELMLAEILSEAYQDGEDFFEEDDDEEDGD